MATQTTSVASATETSLLALTTPFVPPPECTPFSRMTLIESTSTDWRYTTNSTSTYTVVFEDPADVRFTACQPSGWGSVVTSSRFTFSPAVCPSGWLAYSVRTSAKSSRAYCCQSGYTPSYGYDELITDPGTMLCYSTYPNPGSPSATSSYYSYESTSSLNTTVFAHPAWNIIWGKKDQPTLSPQPPDLPADKLILTWTPGTPVNDSSYINDSQSVSNDSGLSGLVVLVGCGIGIPAFFILLCCGCCCWSWRSKKRRNKLATANDAETRRGAPAGQQTELEARNPGGFARPSEDECLPSYTPTSPDTEGDPPAYIDGEQVPQTHVRS